MFVNFTVPRRKNLRENHHFYGNIKKTATQTVKPSTVVIPSDKKGLMCALLQALAKLRAGNTAMRKFVVPLAKEAKRKKDTSS